MVTRTAVVTTQNQIFPTNVVPGGWRWNVALDGGGVGETIDGTSTTQTLTFASAGGYTVRVWRIDASGNALGPAAETRFISVDEGQTIAVALSVAIQ